MGSGSGRIHTSATPTREATPVDELHPPSSTTSSSVASPSAAPQEDEQLATGSTTSKPATEKSTAVVTRAPSHDQLSTGSKEDMAPLSNFKDEMLPQGVHGTSQKPEAEALAVLSHVSTLTHLMVSFCCTCLQKVRKW